MQCDSDNIKQACSRARHRHFAAAQRRVFCKCGRHIATSSAHHRSRGTGEQRVIVCGFTAAPFSRLRVCPDARRIASQHDALCSLVAGTSYRALCHEQQHKCSRCLPRRASCDSQGTPPCFGIFFPFSFFYCLYWPAGKSPTPPCCPAQIVVSSVDAMLTPPPEDVLVAAARLFHALCVQPATREPLLACPDFASFLGSLLGPCSMPLGVQVRWVAAAAAHVAGISMLCCPFLRSSCSPCGPSGHLNSWWLQARFVSSAVCALLQPAEPHVAGVGGSIAMSITQRRDGFVHSLKACVAMVIESMGTGADAIQQGRYLERSVRGVAVVLGSRVCPTDATSGHGRVS